MDLSDLYAKRADLLKQCRAMIDQADAEGRDLSSDEARRYDEHERELRQVGERIERQERLVQEERLQAARALGRGEPGDPAMARPDPQDGTHPRPGSLPPAARGGVRLLEPAHSFRDAVRAAKPGAFGSEERELSLGAWLRAKVTGDWRDAELERRALGEGTPSAGGHLVPEPLSARFIDIMRNRSVVNAAGARTVPMESQTLTFARAATDPTAGWKSENAAGTFSDPTFEAVVLTAKTLFGGIKMSAELFQDSPNAGQVAENMLAEALALELDRVALVGSGSDPEPQGIHGATGVGTTELGAGDGAVPGNWDFLSETIESVRSLNHEPGAIIVAPRTQGTFDRYKDSDNRPLEAPESVDGLRRRGRIFGTNQVPIDLTTGVNNDTSLVFVGDFSELMIGTRLNVSLEISRQAADATNSAFTNYQVWVRAILRVDIALARPAAFHVVSGVRA